MDVRQLENVVNSLVSEYKNFELARTILDSFEDKLKTIEEHEIVSEICKTINHHTLRLKCLKFAYTHCINSEKLSPYRYELAKTYKFLNEPEKSLFYNDIDYRNDNSNFYTQIERVSFLNALGKPEEADSLVEKMYPQNKEEKVHLSQFIGKKQLRNGDLDMGIKNSILAEKGLYSNLVPYRYWTGVEETGKTVIVHGRGDISDQFSYLRFFKRFKELNMQPVFYSAYIEKRNDILEIYKRHGIDAIDNTNLFTKDFLWVNLSALPAYFQLEEETLWEGPYLTSIKNLKNKIEDDKFKIGIKLTSDRVKNNGYIRDIPVREFFDSLPENVSVYNFDSEKYDNCNNLRGRIESWDDTLDYIDQMDLVISCDTSLAHAAGAMGKNTIVMTSIDPSYFYITNRQDKTTPWYGTNFNIVKQKTVRDWNEPLQEMKELIHICMK